MTRAQSKYLSEACSSPAGAIVMPGSGVRADNAAELRAATGAAELHASLKYFGTGASP